MQDIEQRELQEVKIESDCGAKKKLKKCSASDVMKPSTSSNIPGSKSQWESNLYELLFEHSKLYIYTIKQNSFKTS